MNMKGFDKEGRYTVTITKAQFKPIQKEEDAQAFAILLYGETEDGYGAIADINFMSTVISKGKNQGLTVAQASRKLLADIGVEDGSPMNLPAAIKAGLKCQFSLDWDEYKGERKLKVKFVNPLSELLELDQVDWSAYKDMLAQAGTTGKVAKPMPKFDPPVDQKLDAGADDIPF